VDKRSASTNQCVFEVKMVDALRLSTLQMRRN
jgi:hypothetical protein